jgi:cytochrome c oxidase subunit 3
MQRESTYQWATELEEIYLGDDKGAGFGGEGEGENSAAPLSAAQLGMWAFLATVAMLFAGFTSAILVRREAADWYSVPLPGLLWINTALLLGSSLTLEGARLLARRERWRAFKGWLSLTLLLGLTFGIGQVGAWQQLAAQGVFLPSNPYASFFYILTGLHGLHLVGGILALGYLLTRTLQNSAITAPQKTLKVCATYWHFVDGLWLYLFLMLSVI